jgi:hypothetical protein
VRSRLYGSNNLTGDDDIDPFDARGRDDLSPAPVSFIEGGNQSTRIDDLQEKDLVDNHEVIHLFFRLYDGRK